MYIIHIHTHVYNMLMHTGAMHACTHTRTHTCTRTHTHTKKDIYTYYIMIHSLRSWLHIIQTNRYLELVSTRHTHARTHTPTDSHTCTHTDICTGTHTYRKILHSSIRELHII